MVVFKRKQVVITIIFCMILVAGYINWAYQPQQQAETVSNEQTEYLGETKMVNAETEKEKGDLRAATDAKITARNKAVELLNSIVNNSATDEATRKEALSQLAQIADDMEKEGICEGVLNSKGLGEIVVYISEGNATVTVKTQEEISNDTVNKISDVIVSNTKIPADKIKISKVK